MAPPDLWENKGVYWRAAYKNKRRYALLWSNISSQNQSNMMLGTVT